MSLASLKLCEEHPLDLRARLQLTSQGSQVMIQTLVNNFKVSVSVSVSSRKKMYIERQII